MLSVMFATDATRPQANSTSDGGEDGAWSLGILVAVASFLPRIFFAARLPLFPDETYYWDWSRHLAGGYFDHPPGVAVLIRAGTVAFGATPLGVRSGFVLASLALALVVMATTRRLAGDGAALRASLALACMPLAATGMIGATPDPPVLLAAAVVVHGVVVGVQDRPGGRAAWVGWLLAALGLGAAFLSKYTAVLVPFGVLVGLLTVAPLRAQLRSLPPYAAAVIGLALFAPVVAWNASHGWASFAFQLGHGLGTPSGSAVSHELELVGGQIGLYSPILFALMVIAVVEALRRGRPEMRLLAVAAVSIFAFFAFSALRKRVEANWPALAYVPATIVLAARPPGPGWRRWFAGGCVLGALLIAVVYAQGIAPVLPIAARRDPIGRGFGWDDVAEAAWRVGTEPSSPGAAGQAPTRVFFAATRYQNVSELAFHLSGHPEVLSVRSGGRPNEYDFRPGFPDVAQPGDDLVLVVGDGPEPPPEIAVLTPAFARVERGPAVERRRGSGVVGTERIYVFRRWSGAWPPAMPPHDR